MPQAVATFFVSLGLSALAAQVVAFVAVAVATSFLSSLLIGKPNAKSDRTERAIKSPTPARNRSFGVRRLHGAWVLFDTSSSGTTVDVWAFHDGRVNAVLQPYINDEPVEVSGGYLVGTEDGAYTDNTVGIGWNLGLPTETAFSAIVSRMSGIWTADHRGDGIASAYLTKKPVKAKRFIERYPQGDNVLLSLAMETRLCFDPRQPSHDPADPETWTFTENAALHLLTYFITDRDMDYATRFLPVIGLWIAAADHCDEAVPLAAGGTEIRYRGCVAYEVTAIPGDIISELLACFDGWTAQDANGCQTVYSGKVYAPTVSIGPDEIVGYSLQQGVEDENFVNELIVQYVSPLHKYDVVECQAWRDETDIGERGRINSDGFAPQVPSHTQARRLAKRGMLRRNAPNRGTITTNFAGRSVIGHRYVNLRIEEAGVTFFDGIAEIAGAERDFDTGGVTFEWVEAVTSMDGWIPVLEDGEAAPVGTRVPPAGLTAPTIISAAVNFDAGYARIEIDGTGPDRDDLTWFARTRIAGEVSWIEAEYTDTDAAATVALLTAAVPSNATVEVEIAYATGDGRASPWSATSTVDTSTAGLPPAPPTEVSATGAAGSAGVTWRNPTSANLSHVKVFRHTTSTFGSASAITGDVVGGLGQVMSINDTGLAAGTYYYWVVAYNGSGVASAPGGPDPATVT